MPSPTPQFQDQLVSCKEVKLDDHLLELIGLEYASEATENAQYLSAFVFEYEVRGKRYNGFFIRPAQGDGPFPVIIYNRGGSSDFGVIKVGRFFRGTIAQLVRAGYAIIGSQCMGFGEGGAPDEMGGEDFYSVLALYDLIAVDSSLDSTRIGLYGGSRGGTTMWRLLAEGRPAKAAVIISGMANYLDDNFRPKMREHFAKLFGGSPEEREKRSVLAWPEKLPKNVPMLMMYGTSDWRVDPRTGLELSKRCIDLQIPHRLVLFEGADHGLIEHRDAARDLTLQWFDRFVKHDEPLPDMTPHGE